MGRNILSVLLAFLILMALAGNASAAPTITDVDTSHVDGSFTIGEDIIVDVTYNESVDVDTTEGIPSITMNSGGFAVYDSGSGSDVLTFTYAVDAGENSADLDYNAADSLVLNGGFINDTATGLIEADNTLPIVGTFAGAHAIVIDTTAPVITRYSELHP